MSFDFETAVLQRSHQVPVVVDFWATWCAPCRVLGPLLDRLAEQAGGRWELVKIDTEQSPELAARYEIRGIPAVRMFVRGEPTAEFVGALPEGDVRRWLDSHLPDPRGEQLEAILAERFVQPRGEWLARLQACSELQPDHAAARAAWSRELVVTDPTQAVEWIRELDGDPDWQDDVDDVNSLAELAQSIDRAPAELRSHLEQGWTALQHADFETALVQLVQAVKIDRRFEDELPRRATIAVFRWLGHDHEISREHRSAFSMALHS